MRNVRRHRSHSQQTNVGITDMTNAKQEFRDKLMCGSRWKGHDCELEAGHEGMCKCGDHFSWKCLDWNVWEEVEAAAKLTWIRYAKR